MSVTQRSTTDRLVLEPIGPEHVDDVWTVHQDPVVAEWYGGAWSKRDAAAFCERCAWAWVHDGACKWVAYERQTGELVGRGGLSRLPSDSDKMRSIAALVADPVWEADRLELGWALLGSFRGRGLATEIGREGLRFAVEVLEAARVVAFTERHNRASRGVMERLEMQLRGEIRTVGLIEGDTSTIYTDAPFAVYATRAGSGDDFSTRVRSDPVPPR
jgi:RimJ/RimL family protein N-acetyltransferase